MSFDHSETIYALCSGKLPSAVAIFRVSGDKAFPWCARFFQSKETRPVSERGMYFGSVIDDKKPVDEVLLLSFPGPRSLTGEDVIEIQCHGSLGVARCIEATFIRMGIRSARPGEFSYRALANGKMNPSRIDELGDLFAAQEVGDVQRIFSRRERGLEKEIYQLREHLIRLLAVLDTAVDFSEEYSSVVSHALPLIEMISREINLVIHRYSSFRAGSLTPRIVLAGRPNAGKSSLFNALVGRYRAIVHEKPGTTRDVIEEDVEIGGRLWKIVDTAGMRPVAMGAESQGMELGREFLSGAAFWILVVDGTVGMRDEDHSLLREFGSTPHMVVWNKSDLSDWKTPPEGAISGHVKSLNGTQVLLEQLGERIGSLAGGSERVLPTATETAKLRHCHSELETLKAEIRADFSPEYLAERARRILSSLDSVVGEVTTEDVLDRVFNEFCIGK